MRPASSGPPVEWKICPTLSSDSWPSFLSRLPDPDLPMNAPRPKLSWLGRLARAIAFLLLGYWGIYALVTPVTTADSQMYHLARLDLALRGGLFNCPWFTSVYQLI
ncbi:MAG: hypothetical protein ABI222_16705 [Opitutaceae bacterium]